jgi:hypothetical protein
LLRERKKDLLITCDFMYAYTYGSMIKDENLYNGFSYTIYQNVENMSEFSIPLQPNKPSSYCSEL